MKTGPWADGHDRFPVSYGGKLALLPPSSGVRQRAASEAEELKVSASACDVVREEATAGSAELGRLPDVKGASKNLKQQNFGVVEGVNTYSENLGPDVLNGLFTWDDSTKQRGVHSRLGLRCCFSTSSSEHCHCPGFVETLCAIGLLTLDEMEPHRERSIAEHRAPRWHARRLFRKLSGAKAKVP